jgi:zinc/manganese transport system substrate-binding protein
MAATGAARAQAKLPVIATFSILADLTRRVGGERIELVTLVPPGNDAHVYDPTPDDARKLAAAKLIIANGLGFEGWIERLTKAAGAKAPTLIATKGVKPIKETGEHAHGKERNDPHAWQSVANVKIYVANIRDGLIGADAEGAETYRANAAAFIAELDALEKDVRDTINAIPRDRRRIITTHDAFAYFGATYGFSFIAPKGVSTESEPSAADVAKIIRQIKTEKIPAVFLENVTDPRLMQRIAKESGAKIGGTLFSDALSPPDGPAGTYVAMVRNNLRELSAALAR